MIRKPDRIQIIRQWSGWAVVGCVGWLAVEIAAAAAPAQLELSTRTRGPMLSLRAQGSQLLGPWSWPRPTGGVGDGIPVVKVVPQVPSDPTIPHDTWSGKTITLKGACDRQDDGSGTQVTYSWSPGDGSPDYTGVVTDMFVIEATHVYSDPAGTIRSATLTVTDHVSGQSASKSYLIKTSVKSLAIEVNVAIDEGLWYLHKTMNRDTPTEGYWPYEAAVTPANVQAFEVNGHLESGPSSNPYTETVSRGLRRCFELLVGGAFGPDMLEPNEPFHPEGTAAAPDGSAGNGYYVRTQAGNELYQGGTFMDAIIASGTPGAVVPLDLPSGQVGTGPGDLGIVGRTYKEIVQDMVDYYAAAQSDGWSKSNCEYEWDPDYYGCYTYYGCHWDETYVGPLFDEYCQAVLDENGDPVMTENGSYVDGEYQECYGESVEIPGSCDLTPNTIGGGWRYGYDMDPDNSASQWAAIGIIPAARNWGCTIPPKLHELNLVWLNYSQNRPGNGSYSHGIYGYDGPWPLSGVPYGTTPSGMVQCALNGVGRGNPLWSLSETFLRDNFGNVGDYGVSLKRNYYGLYAFVKAMLLHDSNNDGTAEPIHDLQSATVGINPIDWYGVEANPANPLGPNNTDGVARSVVNDQSGNGAWAAFGWFDDYNLQTAWSIIMLQRTLFEAGSPVAVPKASPNPAVAGQTINLDGSDSYHQDPSKSIVSWEWDIDNDGVFGSDDVPADPVGPFANVSFANLGTYRVGLRVRDGVGAGAVGTAAIDIVVAYPPAGPTADAGGPYNFCLDSGTRWYLDGTGSTNPDDGGSEPPPGTNPGDMIVAWDWDLDLDSQYDDANVAQPDVTAYFTSRGVGTYFVNLRVTDRSHLSYPSSPIHGGQGLSGVDNAVVNVLAGGDDRCRCADDLEARAKAAYGQVTVNLAWEPAPGAYKHHIYRGTVAGGPYLMVGESTTSAYVDGPLGLAVGTTYYYVVREADALGRERCQSDETSVTPRDRVRRP